MKKLYLAATMLVLSILSAIPAFAAGEATTDLPGEKAAAVTAPAKAAIAPKAVGAEVAPAVADQPAILEKTGEKPASAEESQDPTKIVAAVVNGQEITMAALIEEMNRQAPQILRKSSGQVSEQETKQVEKAAIDSLIFIELAHQYGRKNFQVAAAEIEETVDQIKKSLGHAEYYQDYLRDKNLTEETLRQEIEKRLLVKQAFAREVDEKSDFDEKEARREYDAKPELFTIPVRIEVDDIIIEAGGDKEAAAGKAASLAAKLAELKSLDKLPAEDGKDLRTATVTLFEDKDAELFKEVAALEPGAVSKPLALDNGYRLLLVRDKKAAELIPFDKARKWFAEQTKKKRARAWFDELKKGAQIEVKID